MTSASLTTRIGLTLLFMALLAVVSVIPGRAQPGDSVFVYLVEKTSTLLQKTMHLLFYAMLTLLWVWTLDAIESKLHRFVIAIVIAVCFGAVLEWYQTKVPGRFGTVVDVALNSAGSLLGMLIAIFLF
jgi:VanZ family protein